MLCCAKDNVVTEARVSFQHHPIPRRAPPLLLLLAVRSALALGHKQGKAAQADDSCESHFTKKHRQQRRLDPSSR